MIQPRLLRRSDDSPNLVTHIKKAISWYKTQGTEHWLETFVQVQASEWEGQGE